MDEAASVELAAGSPRQQREAGAQAPASLSLNTENPLENISTANGDRM
jgi:hypothetical protein